MYLYKYLSSVDCCSYSTCTSYDVLHVPIQCAATLVRIRDFSFRIYGAWVYSPCC